MMTSDLLVSSPSFVWGVSSWHFHYYIVGRESGQLTTARTNQTTGLTNGRAENWAPELYLLVLFALFPVLN